VNLDGELVGINTAIASRTGAYQGYGFAIPSSLMERVVTDLVEYGELQRGYLGVSIQEVTAEVADEVGVDEIQGVYVAGVRSGGAADRSGLREGDIVRAVDGRPVDAANQLQSAVAAAHLARGRGADPRGRADGRGHAGLSELAQ